MIEIKETDLNGVLLRTNTFAYDSKKRLAATTYGAVGQTYRPIYEKNASGHEYPDDVVVGIKLDGKFTDQTTKDGLGRVSTRTLTVENSPLLTENYSYLKTSLASGKTIETAIVSGTTCQIGSTSANTSYTYDISGNIETVTVDSVLVAKYHYDKWNRIVREDNHKFGKTYTWEYDIGGNITEKRTYALCTGDAVGGEYTSDNYEYATSGWKDQLTSFNGEVCEYDALGNPTTYRGKTLNWTKVRRLAKFGDVEFTYNANGTRTSKTANGITHTYTLVGGSVVKETDGINTLIYYIGGNGFVGFNCNGIDYYYRKNPQGDVIGIYTSSGVKVASYVYDAWGNHKIFDANGNEVTSTTHIGYINPIRYRGYYFDVETGLYYLQSRYYDPICGRFLNADRQLNDTLLGYNLYLYCDNNPIEFVDFNGDAPTKSVDQNGDGAIDYYIYDYTYTKRFWFFGWGELVYRGSVYIYVDVDRDYFESAEFKKPTGFNPNTDLLVADLTEKDLNMYAYQAHKVKEQYHTEILNCILQYDRDFNTPWERTLSSLLVEWKEHNRYAIHRDAQNVDFDNAEEGKGVIYFLCKAIGRLVEKLK